MLNLTSLGKLFHASVVRTRVGEELSEGEARLYGENESNEPLDDLSSKTTSRRSGSIISKVGEELSEGEARVLMSYGWIPNTGAGTMLNYCDRVFHDGERWRKIARSGDRKLGSCLWLDTMVVQ
ncbi:hypothetical protein RND71_022214 [Anisodus tanguticus]|uniref:Uncharacterized protein n=1 Tax=Anisodus tanguticus TaxID=243964 RepID=A0AAE1RYI4_9SOLA|nr:hypothetical protein RND71_022214 [Anisodus tanguticus]